VLYARPERVERMLGLRSEGWELAPNFHFGFREKGLTWTKSRLGIDAYVHYWMGRIRSLKAFRREAWTTELARLVDDGVFDPDDVADFARDFTETRRQEATPRPGIRLTKTWPLTGALADGFAVHELQPALASALVALGEGDTWVAAPQPPTG
jgi:hypothetical protein